MKVKFVVWSGVWLLVRLGVSKAWVRLGIRFIGRHDLS